jgi:hypothetical protein
MGYGPSLAWCRYVSRRWGTGRLRTDIGLRARWSDLGWGPLVWLGAIAAQIAAASIVLALDLPIANNTDGIESVDADRTYVIALVITAVIAAPLVEEMVFRGVVQRGLRSRLPLVAVIVVQGVLFGAAHVDPVRGAGNIGLVIVLSGVGIALGVATALFRRLGPAIIAHAIFNAAVLLIVVTGVVERLEDLDAAPGGSVEQVGVVDQPDGADGSRDRDAVAARSAFLLGEVIDRFE